MINVRTAGFSAAILMSQVYLPVLAQSNTLTPTLDPQRVADAEYRLGIMAWITCPLICIALVSVIILIIVFVRRRKTKAHFDSKST